MQKILAGNIPRGVDGRIDVILANRDNKVVYTDKNGNEIKLKRKYGDNAKARMAGKEEKDYAYVIKDFTYLNFKKEGSKITTKEDVQDQLKRWVLANTPPESMVPTDLDYNDDVKKAMTDNDPKRAARGKTTDHNSA